MRALVDQLFRALGCAHAAADAAAGFPGDAVPRATNSRPSHGGVQIDDLDFGERGELAQHLERRIAFERFVAALDQLDDFAVHEIDAGNNHLLTGTWWPARNCLRSPTV